MEALLPIHNLLVYHCQSFALSHLSIGYLEDFLDVLLHILLLLLQNRGESTWHRCGKKGKFDNIPHCSAQLEVYSDVYFLFFWCWFLSFMNYMYFPQWVKNEYNKRWECGYPFTMQFDEHHDSIKAQLCHPEQEAGDEGVDKWNIIPVLKTEAEVGKRSEVTVKSVCAVDSI